MNSRVAVRVPTEFLDWQNRKLKRINPFMRTPDDIPPEYRPYESD